MTIPDLWPVTDVKVAEGVGDAEERKCMKVPFGWREYRGTSISGRRGRGYYSSFLQSPRTKDLLECAEARINLEHPLVNSRGNFHARLKHDVICERAGQRHVRFRSTSSSSPAHRYQHRCSDGSSYESPEHSRHAITVERIIRDLVRETLDWGRRGKALAGMRGCGENRILQRSGVAMVRQKRRGMGHGGHMKYSGLMSRKNWASLACLVGMEDLGEVEMVSMAVLLRGTLPLSPVPFIPCCDLH